MPLPGSGTISLQGHSRPGDALHSKPKQAMIVRMSVETLEAIQTSPHPQMQFKFGQKPGIHIGDSFFPMRPLQETSPHEIFLRTASVAKPNAPLKYYADVTGKFIIHRQLGEEVENSVRGRTKVAEQQRLERKAILLDAPPSDVSAGGSKKQKDAAARKAASLPRRNLATPTSSLPSRIGSPLPPQPGAAETVQPLRNRLIHCLAVNQRTTDYLARMVYGVDSAHQDFLDLLNEIAEQPPPPKKKSDNQTSGMWKLKTKTWMEVRPYEWPKLSEPERTTMARQARMAFADLKIPESDPLWDYVRYRNTGYTPPAPSTSSSRSESQVSAVKKVEPKRPAISKEKTKALPRKKAEQLVTAKDESSRASGSRISAKDESQKRTAPAPLTASSSSAPPRRLPGSGFKAKPSPTPSNRSPSTTESSKKPGLADAREAKRDNPASSVSTRPVASPALKPIPKKAKDRGDVGGPDSSTVVKRKKFIKQEEGELIEPSPPPAVGIKRKRKSEESTTSVVDRKQASQEEEGELIEPVPSESIRKKRKMENRTMIPAKEHLMPPKKILTRDPSPLVRPAVKDPSTAPVPSNGAASLSKSVSSKFKGNSKFKRGSSIYTSSEDERSSVPLAKSQSAPQNKSLSSTSPVMKKRELHQRPKAPLPKDAAGLRTRYKSTYLPYIVTYQQVISEKTKLDNALNGTFTDSDGDVDIMDAETLTRLMEEHKAYKDELESIQAAYIKAGGNGPLKPEISGSSSSD